MASLERSSVLQLCEQLEETVFSVIKHRWVHDEIAAAPKQCINKMDVKKFFF